MDLQPKDGSAVLANMKKYRDISQVDPEEWKFYVSTYGYDAQGYSMFAARFLLTILFNPAIFAELTKELSRFQVWYYANRDRRIAYDRKYYAEHRLGHREAAKRWRERLKKEHCK